MTSEAYVLTNSHGETTGGRALCAGRRKACWDLSNVHVRVVRLAWRWNDGSRLSQQKCQKALIHARLQEGAEQGVSTFVVETEVPSPEKANISNANLTKMGFVHRYNRSNLEL